MRLTRQEEYEKDLRWWNQHYLDLVPNESALKMVKGILEIKTDDEEKVCTIEKRLTLLEKRDNKEATILPTDQVIEALRLENAVLEKKLRELETHIKRLENIIKSELPIRKGYKKHADAL